LVPIADHPMHTIRRSVCSRVIVAQGFMIAPADAMNASTVDLNICKGLVGFRFQDSLARDVDTFYSTYLAGALQDYASAGVTLASTRTVPERTRCASADP
jgi:hypothetical protein